jgi:hypothetical protein
MTLFWDAVPSSLAEIDLLHQGDFVPDYTERYPRRQLYLK